MSEYPVEILPHESYKAKMDVDSLASHEENACVVRRVAEKPQLDMVFGVMVFVNYGILQAKDVLDMSTYLWEQGIRMFIFRLLMPANVIGLGRKQRKLEKSCLIQIIGLT